MSPDALSRTAPPLSKSFCAAPGGSARYMPIIIDGWNLVRNEKSDIDDGELEGIETARRLIVYLEEFQRGRGDPVIVVFDSTREHLALDFGRSRRLTIVPSANADEYIKH